MSATVRISAFSASVVQSANTGTGSGGANTSGLSLLAAEAKNGIGVSTVVASVSSPRSIQASGLGRSSIISSPASVGMPSDSGVGSSSTHGGPHPQASPQASGAGSSSALRLPWAPATGQGQSSAVGLFKAYSVVPQSGSGVETGTASLAVAKSVYVVGSNTKICTRTFTGGAPLYFAYGSGLGLSVVSVSRAILVGSVQGSGVGQATVISDADFNPPPSPVGITVKIDGEWQISYGT